MYVFMSFAIELPRFKNQCTKAIFGGKIRYDAMLIHVWSKRNGNEGGNLVLVGVHEIPFDWF